MLHAELGATSVYVTHDQEEAMTLSDRIVVMSRGKLEQYGTPFEVYHKPASEFVASFVGKPRMNLFTAKKSETGRYVLPGTNLELDVDDVSAATIRIGLRPEECDLKLATNEASAHGTVRAIEPLGNVSDVVLMVGTETFLARVPGFGGFDVGDFISIETQRATIHCFDVESGRRL